MLMNGESTNTAASQVIAIARLNVGIGVQSGNRLADMQDPDQHIIANSLIEYRGTPPAYAGYPPTKLQSIDEDH